MSFLPPDNPARLIASDNLAGEQADLQRKAERYAQLHGTDDPVERRPGIVARLLSRLRGRHER